jgi:Ca2+/Na+ antiporter
MSKLLFMRMKKHIELIQMVQRYLAQPILRYRHIWLPVASTCGVVFFILCDYVTHAIIAYIVIFIWLYYALFLICRYANVEVCHDEQGNIFIQHKQENTKQKSEKS